MQANPREVNVEREGIEFVLNENGQLFRDGKMVHDHDSGDFYTIPESDWLKQISVKRMVAEHFVPNPEGLRYSMHKVPGSIAAGNLYWSKSNRRPKK